ncbi:replicative helicase loader/inhibitor [Paenibacillus harenae]|uniref:replicative helicase loader/inhibitor n=1 Tax=Paenibacillus harenae TaxID=306543 RepID=UPI00041CC72B|nr:replicative helicase loader/inhibitor [Paenibacillus harenae]
MKRAEIIKLVGICSLNYRNWPEAGKEEALISLWETMLDDIDYEIGRIVIKKFMSESVYPPTIADIRARIADVTTVRSKPGIEAWGDVKLAIRKYGSYNEKKAMDSLTGVTRKVVDSIGFRTLCLSENEMADRAHFLKVYDTMQKREREDALLMPELRDSMTRIQSNSGRMLTFEEDQGA